MNRPSWFASLPIRHKLLLSYSAVFVLVAGLGSAVTYSLVRRTIEANIESELKNSTAGIVNMVRTSADVAIRSHLRALAEKNREIVHHFHRRQLDGSLSEAEARARAAEVLLSQGIGKTGYMYALDSQGVVRVHPKHDLVDVDLSQHAFVREQAALREGYQEYYWRNPEEDRARPKAVYMAYFAPWDWIISASAYREEFKDLLEVSDFRAGVLALRFGQSGYAYVMDRQGSAVLHPKYQDKSIFEQEDVPVEFLEEMLERKSGKILYSWRNPGEQTPREKLVMFQYLPEYEWVAASSSYLEEVYAPLRAVRNIVFLSVAGSLLLVLPLTFRISSSITNPLKELRNRLSVAARGDLSARDGSRVADEVGQLAAYFDTFLEQLGGYSASLEAEIQERRQAEAALRESEARYRSVMEAAPDPITVYDMEGRVTYFNPAFTRVFGWALEERLGKKLDHFVPDDCWAETRHGIQRLLAGETLSGVETRRRTREGRSIHVSISGAPYRGPDGGLAGTVIILRDVNEQVRAEKALRLSEEMFSKAFRSSPHGIWIAGLGDQRFLDVNDAFLRLTGYARGELIGKGPGELALFPQPTESHRLRQELRGAGQLRGHDLELRARSGEVRLGRVSAEVIDLWDEPCMLATVEDVTEARRLEREVIETGDRERQRIGEDLHDDLGPHLIGVEVLSKVLMCRLQDALPAEAGQAEQIRALIAEAIQKARAMARGLRPVHVTDNGLEFALKELAKNTEVIFGVPCTFRSEAPVRVFDNAVATQLFYIAREAVHNAVKHARAGGIAVALARQEGDVLLTVRDDGVGIPAVPGGGGMGLRIMGFRARTIGANLTLIGRPGQGTLVSLSVATGDGGPETRPNA